MQDFRYWHVLSFLAATSSILISSPLLAASANLPALEMRQMREAWQREKVAQEALDLQKNAETQAAMPEAHKADVPAGAFSFELKSIGHTASEVLTEDEFTGAVSPWIGKRITTTDIAEILNAVNRLYRSKGYVVCLALVKPQRIRDGHLTLTLVEGKTDEVTVSGNETTSTSYIENAFHFEEGKTANYQTMLDDLVRFNMTNDATLQIDMGPGTKPMTTSYRINTTEPRRWGASAFFDTTGSRSTGRARGGVTLTNRSLFGRRDAVTLLGMASRGNKSGMLGYAIPLNSRGTKLSLSGSYSDVKVVKGPSEDRDVKGKSWMISARLEYPVYVSSTGKVTLWGEASRLNSKTDAFADVSVADSRTVAMTGGIDFLHIEGNSGIYTGSVSFTEHHVKDRLFETKTHYDLFTASFAGRNTFACDLSVTVSGRLQMKVAGDELNSSDYFYLGHTNGVRGYDNDLIGAEAGISGSVEVAYPIFGPKTSLYAFADGGRFNGIEVSKQRYLYSAGLGFTWQPYDWAYINATVAFPLKRHLADGTYVGRARGDVTVSVIW